MDVKYEQSFTPIKITISDQKLNIDKVEKRRVYNTIIKQVKPLHIRLDSLSLL